MKDSHVPSNWGVTYIDKERNIEQTKRQERIMETGGRRKALGQNNLNKDFHFSSVSF